MIICVCAGITESEIEVAAKCDKVADLYCRGMCQSCGSCREDVEKIVSDFIQDEDDEYYE